jgi:DNA transformation protein and related proteins
MSTRDEDIAWFVELLAPIGRITGRRMFGGAGIYADGMIVGLEVDGALYLKTDDQTRQAFADAGGHPFVYDGKGKHGKGKHGKGKAITMSYWTPPDEAMDSPEAMRPWAQRALDAAFRSAVAKPTKKAASRNVAVKKAIAKKPAAKKRAPADAAPKTLASKTLASKKKTP